MVVLRCTLLLLILRRASPFADWMAKDYCDRKLEVGEVVMNSEIGASSERLVKVLRGESELSSQDSYRLGETLTVTISNTNNQFVFDTVNADFVGGGCKGKRIAGKKGKVVQLVMPSEGRLEVSVWAGWATGHEAVTITPRFILTPPASSVKLVESARILDSKEEIESNELLSAKAAALPKVELRADKGSRAAGEEHTLKRTVERLLVHGKEVAEKSRYGPSMSAAIKDNRKRLTDTVSKRDRQRRPGLFHQNQRTRDDPGVEGDAAAYAAEGEQEDPESMEMPGEEERLRHLTRVKAETSLRGQAKPIHSRPERGSDGDHMVFVYVLIFLAVLAAAYKTYSDRFRIGLSLDRLAHGKGREL